MATTHDTNVTAHGPGDGEAVWFLDNLLTIKTSRASGSPFGLVESSMPAGSHTPFHVHDREAEAFYVLEGTLVIYFDGGRKIIATPGTFVHVPPGTGHGFRTETPVRMLVLCFGEGFIEMAREAGVSAERPVLPPPVPPDHLRLEQACGRHGIRILGPLPDSQDGVSQSPSMSVAERRPENYE